MATTTDRDLFFQTTQSLDQAENKAKKSKNEDGQPFRLPSKILAVVADPSNPNGVYIAESAGTTRKFDVEARETKRLYRGPNAPLTCLALSASAVYAGSWDKSIWSWHIETGTPGPRFHGHTDFVKALLFLELGSGRRILISGSADASIIVWDAKDGSKIHVLKGHARGVLALAIDPASFEAEELVIFSASSDPHIRRWTLKRDLSFAGEIEPEKPIQQHETSVNALRFDYDGDLWTASSDGTAKCLSREHRWQADTVLRHGDYVRDVAVNEVSGFVATVGRDEEVKVWQKGNEKLWHTYSGHFEEISACVLLRQHQLVTVGIDCTLRQWSLSANDLQSAREEAAEAASGQRTEHEMGTASESLLTEEEEKELAELTEDD